MFATPGTRVITGHGHRRRRRARDDAEFIVRVVSLVDAIKGVADTLTQLIQSAEPDASPRRFAPRATS